MEYNFLDIKDLNLDDLNLDLDDLDLDLDDLDLDKVNKNLLSKVYLHPIPRYMGAFFINKRKHIQENILLQWKNDYKAFPEFSERIISDFVNMWQMRKTYIDYITIPPPSAKRKGYSDHPMNYIAEQVSTKIGIKYIPVFNQIHQSGRGCKYRSQHPYEITFSRNEPGIAMVIDDITTSGITFMQIQQAYQKINKPVFCVAWGSYA